MYQLNIKYMNQIIINALIVLFVGLVLIGYWKVSTK